MRDKYNLNTLPASLANMDENDYDDNIVIPALGNEDKVDISEGLMVHRNVIPGLDLDTSSIPEGNARGKDKKPFNKPIPKNFQNQWNNIRPDDDSIARELKVVIGKIVEQNKVVPLKKIAPNAIMLGTKIVEIRG